MMARSLAVRRATGGVRVDERDAAQRWRAATRGESERRDVARIRREVTSKAASRRDVDDDDDDDDDDDGDDAHRGGDGDDVSRHIARADAARWRAVDDDDDDDAPRGR